MAYGATFLIGTRPMIDFQLGNERYGGAFRYFGRCAIFHPQTLRTAGIWIFSTQTSGGDLNENGHSQTVTSHAP